MNIYFCDTCGKRVSDSEVLAGARGPQGKMRCHVCAANAATGTLLLPVLSENTELVTEEPDAPAILEPAARRHVSSVRIAVVKSPTDRRYSSAEHTALRTPSGALREVEARKAQSSSTKTLYASIVGAVLLLGAVVIAFMPAQKPASDPAQVANLNKEPLKNTAIKPEAPVVKVAAPTPAPIAPSTEEKPAIPLPAPESPAEQKASTEFTALQRAMDAMPHDDLPGRTKLLETFINDNKETLAASRARVALEHLKAPPQPVKSPKLSPAAAGDRDDDVAFIEKMKELNGPNTLVKVQYYGKRITYVSCYYTQIDTIAPVAMLKSLQSLVLVPISKKKNNISDLSPLAGLPITKLTIPDASVGDLSPLKGMKLTYLNLSKDPVADLSPLEGMPLDWLGLDGTAISTISALKGMPIKTLTLRGTAITDISALKGMPLNTLDLNETKVSDLTPLAGMKLLSLSVGTTGVTDISILKGMPLVHLGIGHNAISDLSILKEMPLVDLGIELHTQEDVQLLRGINTLKKINNKPADKVLDEFKPKAH